MASLENQFVMGLFWKTLLLGCVAILASGFLVSWPFGGAVAMGVLVSGLNLRVVGWVSRKMAEAALEGDKGVTKWTLLLVVKLLFLFVLTYLAVIVLGADAVGYVIGYSTFLPAIFWQSAVYIRNLPEEDDEHESDDHQDTK
ncbi:MAG: hypothetical protein ACQEVA_09580 [Myxococcota bacterium]